MDARQYPSDAADSSMTTKALSSWISINGLPEILVTDQGTHSKNQVMTELAERFKIQHHFTTALISFSNGTIERINRDIIKVFRALLKEWNLDLEFWPLV